MKQLNRHQTLQAIVDYCQDKHCVYRLAKREFGKYSSFTVDNISQANLIIFNWISEIPNGTLRQSYKTIKVETFQILPSIS